MTDSEIIQALECCLNAESESCNDCKYSGYSACVELMACEAVALIKRQQAEIERLKWYAANMEYCANHALDEIEKEKREAIKDFAERLKAQAYTAENEWSQWAPDEHPLVVEVDDIDTLVAEMEGENGRA